MKKHNREYEDDDGRTTLTAGGVERPLLYVSLQPWGCLGSASFREAFDGVCRTALNHWKEDTTLS